MAFNLTRRRFLQSASLAAVSVPPAKVFSAKPGFVESTLERKASFGNEGRYRVGFAKGVSGAASGLANVVKAGSLSLRATRNLSTTAPRSAPEAMREFNCSTIRIV